MAGNDNIRVTTLYPGAVASELKFSSGDAESAAGIQAFYDTVETPADSIARAVAYAIEQPENVAVNEITLRPAKQEFDRKWSVPTCKNAEKTDRTFICRTSDVV